MNKQTSIDLRFTTMQEKVPDFIYEGLKKYVKECNTYHLQPKFLRTSISKKFHLPSSDWVFLVSGIDEALRVCVEVFGKHTHVFTPTEYTTTYQFCPSVFPHYSMHGNSYEVSSNRIPQASLILLANPNNPVGYTSKQAIEQLIHNNPHAIIAIDEIYGEYASELSVVELLQKYKNLIIFRGFSKSYGLAGIRLGFVLANPIILRCLAEKATWSNVSYLSCGAAQVALDHEDYYQDLRNSILKRKEKLTKILKQKDLVVIPSLINTLTIKFSAADKSIRFVENLVQKRIFVNLGEEGGKVGVDNKYVSFVVGTNKQIKRLLKEIE